MKSKKLILSVLVAACMLTVSQTAFASGNFSPEPFADSIDKAEKFAEPQFFSHYINAVNDVDWYSYTNTSGKDQYVTVFLLTPKNNNNDLTVSWGSDPDHLKGTANVADRGTDKFDSYTQKIQSGDSIYWKVAPHAAGSFDSKVNYWTWFQVK
ncbi:hypothetical protein K0T92_00045 [Paenibacillus oenotherae]|uniref:Uncharacterized protein n=1 Tax=Paenibacillus oenotherae TaxID=1435645 RepID=A0ABS7CZT3_9BACL|nr:hypothetical protein [Paenibacillus oenotherae]MBW7473125.1 hypothetical protein [Paenibacillus oenotherae]